MERTPAPVLDAYGEFIGGLGSWTDFWTLTHRPPDEDSGNRSTAARPDIPSVASARPYGRPSFTRVGIQRHRRQVREWFYEDVRRMDPGARWWSEMELHLTGQPHEHGLLSVSAGAPVLSMRQAWWDRCGFAHVQAIRSRAAVAAYVAKYAGKSAAWTPLVYGFGLLPAPSFSRTLDLR